MENKVIVVYSPNAADEGNKNRTQHDVAGEALATR